MESKEAVMFKTYKKDRSVMLYLNENGQYQVIESGFVNDLYTGDANMALKQMATSIEIEFPRSKTAWVEHYHNLDSPFILKRSHIRQMP